MDVSGEKTCVRCVKEYTKVCGLKYQDGNPEMLMSGKDKLNNTGNELQIDYACGWAISEDYKESTLQILFDSADSYMYENKQSCKKQNQ